MLDFTLFDKALKIVWVKRLCANEERPWKFIALSLLSNVGGSLLFWCNYNIQYLPLNENLPKFYRDVGCLPFSQIIRMEWSLHKGKRFSEFNDQPSENGAYHLLPSIPSCIFYSI